MATIKSYTDIEQSKKLAKILPLDSADMFWQSNLNSSDRQYLLDMGEEEYFDIEMNFEHCSIGDYDIPAWSLAALLDILPNEIISNNMFECHYQIDIRKYDGGDNTTLYQIAYGNNSGFSGSWHDMISTGEKENLIDCCVQMIIKLNELNLL